MPVGWSRKGLREDVGLSGGVRNAGDGAPLRKGLFLGKSTVRPGESRLSALKERTDRLANLEATKVKVQAPAWYAQ